MIKIFRRILTLLPNKFVNGLKLADFRASLLPNGLYCFNYHRIGNESDTDYDPNVFSCTEESFNTHLEFIGRNFKIITADELQSYIDATEEFQEKVALITFDDGYIDNYSVAFPILEKHAVSALFFLSTQFIYEDKVPWWDELSFMLKKTPCKYAELLNQGRQIEIDKLNISATIRRVIRSFKLDSSRSIEQKMEIMRSTLKVNIEDYQRERLFINWDMVKLMLRSGMKFGSHTCSHQILSHLSPTEQLYEVQRSKEIIENEINNSVKYFAYPVGGWNSFNQTTVSAVRTSDYLLSFTCEKGVNRNLKNHKYELRRFNVNNNCSVDELVSLVWN